MRDATSPVREVGSKAAGLRQRLAASGIVRVAGVSDGLSAILAERHGFDALWASGLGISAGHGVPDASILTMTDLLAAATVVDQASALPVIADCDTGFGDVNNVVRMVRCYESAGIAGVCIEDKCFPKRNSFSHSSQTLAGLEEFAAKLAVAKHAQRDPDFVVIARLEGFIAGASMTEALRRADAYANAGADAVLVHSRARTPVEVLQFAERWPRSGDKPLVVIPTTYPSVRIHDLEAAGIRMVIYANQALRAAAQAMDAVLAKLACSPSALAVEDSLASVDEIFALIGMSEIADTETWADEVALTFAARYAERQPPRAHAD